MIDRELDPGLASALRAAGRRLRWLRFLQASAWLACGVLVVLAGVGWAVHRGWRPEMPLLLGGGVLVALVAFLAWAAIAGFSLSIRRRGSWLAAELEEVNGLLLDRLNTSVALAEGQVDTAPALRHKIEDQARGELVWAAPPFADEVRHTRHAAAFAVLALVATAALFLHWKPWTGLTGSVLDGATPAAEVERDPEPELADPNADTSELATPERAWGEVRITDPGEDLRVTKVDVVPLEIEVAASAPIAGARWTLQNTDGEPRVEELGLGPENSSVTPSSTSLSAAPSSDRRYAVYSPLIYVDELRLSDWDVVSYHAGANASEQHYRSEIYFLEVRPFREDIEKLPGGSGGPGYQGLSELSGLIDRQKTILRQTHRFLSRAGRGSPQQGRDQRKLVEAEADLTVAVQHAYARIASTMENMPVADVLDLLALAEEHLEAATDALEADPATAPGPEQAALAALVETRKSLQRAMSDNPEAFEGDPPDEPMPPVAEELGERLEQISEYRDSEAAAQEALDALAEEQQAIREATERDAAAAGGGDPQTREALGDREREALAELERVRQEHPELLGDLDAEVDAARDALREAARGLYENDTPEAVAEQQEAAVGALEALRQEAESEGAERRLEDAYQLDRLLAEQQDALREIRDAPESTSQSEAASTAEQTQSLLDALGEAAEQGFGDVAGEALQEALDGSEGQQLERQLDRLSQASEAGPRGEAAGQAADALGAVHDAFEQSLPEGVRQLRSQDALQGRPGEALGTALRHLRRLAEADALPEGEAGEQAAGEALARLRRALEEQPDDDPALAGMIRQAEEALEDAEDTSPLEVLRQLMAGIERVREERAAELLDLPEAADLTHIDLSELPAEYRRRIEEYYRRLSER